MAREASAAETFITSQEPEPHLARARDILARHPEVASLSGRNAWTMAIIVGVCGFQVFMAWALQSVAWWWVLIAAYLVGAFFTHALWTMIHECVHQRVLRGAIPNRLAGILANMTMVLPSSVAFEKYHLRHHRYQGVYDRDGDMPCSWEVDAFSGSWWRRACWLLLLPILMAFRPVRLRDRDLWDRWVVLNFVVVLGFSFGVLIAWGPLSLLYLVLSMFFALGLHPLGARWIQEHYTVDGEQETFSYYGPLNIIELNVGYHNEHHDFPGIPWNRLPALRRMAPEAYDPLLSYQSWSRLMYEFVVYGAPNVSGRVVRTARKPGIVAAQAS